MSRGNLTIGMMIDDCGLSSQAFAVECRSRCKKKPRQNLLDNVGALFELVCFGGWRQPSLVCQRCHSVPDQPGFQAVFAAFPGSYWQG